MSGRRAGARVVAGLLAGLLLGLLAGCGGGGPAIEIRPGFARVAPTRDGGAGYFAVVNRGAAPDTLLAVAVEGGHDAELHTMVAQPGSSIVRMAPLGQPAIAAGDSLVLREGAEHLMFGLAAGSPVAQSDSLAVTLRFARSGELRVVLPVLAYGEEAPE